MIVYFALWGTVYISQIVIAPEMSDGCTRNCIVTDCSNGKQNLRAKQVKFGTGFGKS